MTNHPADTALDPAALLAVAVEEARTGLAEGGVPIGAALFATDGTLLGRGHNRRVQDGDPSLHAETAAFRNAGRRPGYRDTIMVTTLSPCWYCSGLVRQFGIGHVVIGEATTFSGGHDWLAEHGVAVTLLEDPECIGLMTDFIRDRPELWAEDIGVDPAELEDGEL
ncbi:nucleoside deaminase [Cryptosporangium aurantiacum]|uniref:Cytosine deaminase n=1 Tax=Cryptosporangium aurantiacum TaxID=134849 RepID=A0A1M7IGI5_9ACTN|nr:nucleoside deaminase [Cryptosporangium aurantiacum]SHM39956.1 cytosine deaminase [Cryptosporangium aurantiacum]